jgi:hypothetical protein
MTDQAMSPLRRRMIEDRGCSQPLEAPNTRRH